MSLAQELALRAADFLQGFALGRSVPREPPPIRPKVAQTTAAAKAARRKRAEAKRKARGGYGLAWRRVIRLAWSPGDDAIALRNAENGSFEMVSELIEAMISDATIEAGLAIRWGGIANLPEQWYGDADLVRELRGDLSDRDKQGGADKPVGEFEQTHPLPERQRIVAWGILLGAGFGEYIEDDDGRSVLEAKDPHYIQVDAEGALWWTEGGAHERIVPGDGRWFAWFPKGAKRFWIHGAWRKLAGPWIHKIHAREQRRAWGRRLAAGILFAVFPKGTPQRIIDRFPQRIKNLVSPILGFEEGTTLEMLESTGRGYEVWKDTVRAENEEMATALVYSPVLINGTKGWSNGDMHKEIVGTVIIDNAITFAQSVTKCGVVPWAKRRGRRAPVFTYNTTAPAVVAALVEALRALEAIGPANAALQPFGKQLRIDETLADLAVKVEDIDTSAPSHPLDEADEFYGELPLKYEVRQGDTRVGIGPNGPWSSTMLGADYGYIVGSSGVDGDAVDVYRGPLDVDDAPVAFVVEQLDADGGLDEHKVMVGFATPEDAYETWLANVPFVERFGGMYAVPIELLRGLTATRETLTISTAMISELTKPSTDVTPEQTEEGQIKSDKQVFAWEYVGNVFKVNEIRRLKGVPPEPRAVGMFATEWNAKLAKEAGIKPDGVGGASAPDPGAPAEFAGDDDMTLTEQELEEVEQKDPETALATAEAVALAASMTSAGIAECEHGKKGRCQICGIRRVRRPMLDAEGKHIGWDVVWRAIGKEISDGAS